MIISGYGSVIGIHTPLFLINQLVVKLIHGLNRCRKHLDWFHGSRMEGFLSTFPPYSASGAPLCAPPLQAKRQGCFITPQGLNYLELCKAIISQANPCLPPPLIKAHTKECGVQVNAKVDKTIQCSLGPKTLFCLEGDHNASPKSPKSPYLLKQDGSTPPVSNLRFLRPVSIYSPVFDRRIHPMKLRDDDGSEGEAEDTKQTESDMDAERDHSGEDARKDIKSNFHRFKGSSFQVGCKGYLDLT